MKTGSKLHMSVHWHHISPTTTKHKYSKKGMFDFFFLSWICAWREEKYAQKNEGCSSRINLKQFEHGTGDQYNQLATYQKTYQPNNL